MSVPIMHDRLGDDLYPTVALSGVALVTVGSGDESILKPNGERRQNTQHALTHTTKIVRT